MGDSGEVSGTVFYLGSSFRIEFESSEDVYISQYPIRLSNDNGATIFYLNSQDKTYFKSHRPLGNSGCSKPDVAITSDGEGEVIAGFTTKKYVLKGSCAFKVLGTGGTLQQIVSLWTAEQFDPPVVWFPDFRRSKSDLSKIFLERLKQIKGLPLKQVWSHTYKLTNGEPVTQSWTVTVDHIAETQLPESKFTVPSDYRYKEPDVTGPAIVPKGD